MRDTAARRSSVRLLSSRRSCIGAGAGAVARLAPRPDVYPPQRAGLFRAAAGAAAPRLLLVRPAVAVWALPVAGAAEKKLTRVLFDELGAMQEERGLTRPSAVSECVVKRRGPWRNLHRSCAGRRRAARPR